LSSIALAVRIWFAISEPGIDINVTFEDASGFVVAEPWENTGATRHLVQRNVTPNVPAEITQEVIKLHSVHKP
jgi:hypothetical protein